MEVLIDGLRYVLQDDAVRREKAAYEAGYADAQKALEKPAVAAPVAPEGDMRAFFSEIRSSLFHGKLTQAQVDGIELLMLVAGSAGLDPYPEQLAYILGTVYHETASTMEPIEEYGGKHARYAPWYGRGFVQLTWERNYKKQQAKLQGLTHLFPSLEWRVHDDRSLAMHPLTSAVICVFGMRDGDFDGERLSDYINHSGCDYIGARRIVNGTDRAQLIAEHAYKFEAALKAGGFA